MIPVETDLLRQRHVGPARPGRPYRTPLGVLIAYSLVLCLLAGCGRATPSPEPLSAPPTPEPTPLATPTATAISTRRPYDIGIFPLPDSQVIAMVRVPAGEFLMGSLDGVGDEDEVPQHPVFLDSFWIDRAEVTNKHYASCVESGGCPPGHTEISFQRLTYYGNPAFDNFPVLYVNWDEAQAFCAWAGKRLPTEAEWEKAARGADGRVYPWGDVFDPNQGNFDGSMGDTAPVGQFPSGASPFEVWDMAGNAAEWVADWYAADYYARSPGSNPAGPDSGEERVVRGGSWAFYNLNIRTADRTSQPPAQRTESTGFRCARSAP